jgi:hypothetical protein
MAAGVGVIAIIVVDRGAPHVSNQANMPHLAPGPAEAVPVAIFPHPDLHSGLEIIGGVNRAIAIVIKSITEFGHTRMNAGLRVVAIISSNRQRLAARVSAIFVNMAIAIFVLVANCYGIAILVMTGRIAVLGISRITIRVGIVAIVPRRRDYYVVTRCVPPRDQWSRRRVVPVSIAIVAEP